MTGKTANDTGAAHPESERLPGVPAVARMRFPWAFVAFAGMGLVTVWLISGRQLDFGVLARAHPLFLTAALGVALVAICLDAMRLQILVRLDRKSLPFLQAVRAVLVYGFFSAITPTSLGGEVSMVWLLNRRGLTPGAAAAVTGIRTILPLAAFCLAMPVFALTSPAQFRGFLKTAVPVGAVLCVVFAVVIIAALVGKGALQRRARQAFARNESPSHWHVIGRALAWVDKTAHECWDLIASAFRERPLVLAAATLVTVVHAFAYLTIVPLCARAFGFGPPFWGTVAGAAVVEIVIVFIPLPGGSGGAEFGIGAVLTASAPDAHGAAVLWAVVMWRIIATHIRVLSGGVLTARIMHRAQKYGLDHAA